MSFETLGWALRLTGISPVAKLIAVCALDGKQGHSRQDFLVDELVEFACCDRDQIEPALAELRDIGFVTKSLPDDAIFIDRHFPPRERVATSAPKDFGVRFIYVVGAVGRIKVGITVNPKGRFQAIQTGFPDLIVKHLLVKGPAASIERAERTALAALAAFNTSGEWFAVKPDMAVAVVREALRGQNIHLGEDGS